MSSVSSDAWHMAGIMLLIGVVLLSLGVMASGGPPFDGASLFTGFGLGWSILGAFFLYAAWNASTTPVSGGEE